MPRGVYPRTANQLKAAVANLAKGREPAAREKATDTNRRRAQDPEWIKKVSENTKKAMHRPEVRKKHLKGLKMARTKYGTNFKGGNGQVRTKTQKLMDSILEGQGFIREYPIKTKKARERFKRIPDNYKADYAHPKKKVVIELDGPSHCSQKQKAKDKKKTTILEHLGWTVLRIKHKRS
jgi:hypothetical protein